MRTVGIALKVLTFDEFKRLRWKTSVTSKVIEVVSTIYKILFRQTHDIACFDRMVGFQTTGRRESPTTKEHSVVFSTSVNV